MTKKILHNWETVTADDVCSLITNWFVGTATTHYTENVWWVIYIQWYNITERGFNFRGIKKVTPEFHLKNKKSHLQEGDLLTIQTWDVGLTSLVPKELEGSNCHALIISRFKKEMVYSPFMLYFYNSNYWRARLKRIETGSTMKHLNVGDLKDLEFLLPPLPEQSRIVAVLETWDRAIEKLTKKIKIKKQIKKGLMQNLLTGKNRLEGFRGKCTELRIGDLWDYYSGLTGKNKEDFGTGKPYISYMNIYSNSTIRTNISDLVQVLPNEKQNKAKYGDIFFTTSSETQDEVGIASVLLDRNVEELYLNSFCFGFRLHDFLTLLPEFARFYLRSRSFRKSMTEIAQWASRYNLSKKYFSELIIRIPGIKEQQAIANILTTADAEITTLGKKLSLLRDQKKYLLNNLITGEIRTPENLTLNS